MIFRGAINDMKRLFSSQKSVFSLLKTFAAWWFTCFVFIFIALSALDLIVSLINGEAKGSKNAFRLIFSAVSAVPACIAVQFLILPKLSKPYGTFRRILLEIAKNGYSDPLIKQMEEQLDVCRSDESRTSYANQYAMFLAEAYISLHSYDKAENALDRIDYEFMKNEARSINSPDVQRNIIMYHVLNVQLSAARMDKDSTEKNISLGEKVFARYRGRSEIIDYLIDIAYFESLLLHKQYDNAIRLIEKYGDSSELEFGVAFDKARCLLRKGCSSEAQELFDKAYSMATNDWRRKTVELERNMTY